ncbi:MoxR family ATPase [Actinomycetaceae bacterium MB13-C1-2]|nr:MoxR family ATPase [Actinomycetaceae bacterium MB13-C1-2]
MNEAGQGFGTPEAERVTDADARSASVPSRNAGATDDVDSAARSSSHLSDQELERAGALLDRVTALYEQRVVGQQELRQALLASLLSQGHVLIESVPGLAKTTAAQTLAQSVSGTFHRIQCTPDLMPNDIVGTQIFNAQTDQFTTQLGPVHANFVLLDEINRSSAKTQSAMLEAMQEKQTTIGGKNYPLPKPFMVMATQNPIEEEGTYVLPEAQMDRFLMKVSITYPKRGEELKVLEMIDSGVFAEKIEGEPISLIELEELQDYASRVYVHSAIKAYIVDIINTTRGSGPNPIAGLPALVRVGSSPRGGIALMKVAQALALMQGRNYVIPEDVKAMRYPVLQHRIIRTWDAIADGVPSQDIIDTVLRAVPVP